MNARCTLCGNKRTKSYVTVTNSPITQNVLYATYSEAVAAEKTDIDLRYCGRCHFLFNANFIEEKIAYNQSYDNNQLCSATYTRYLDNLTSRIVAYCSLGRNSRVLEVGCGSGYFLSEIKRKSGAMQVCGYDPTYADKHEMTSCIKKEYFRALPGKKFDLIIIRHALEGMLNAHGVLNDIVLSMHEQSVIFIEAVSLDFILRGNARALLFHEYPRYYSVIAIHRLLAAYKLEIREVLSLFNNNYFGVFASRRAAPVLDDKPLKLLRKHVAAYKRVVIWGASGRGVSVLTSLGWDDRVVHFAADIDVNKHGKYMPVTGQRIISPQQVLDFRPDLIIVANSSYLDEVRLIVTQGVDFLTLDGILHKSSDVSEV